jgi:hypothetical protein
VGRVEAKKFVVLSGCCLEKYETIVANGAAYAEVLEGAVPQVDGLDNAISSLENLVSGPLKISLGQAAGAAVLGPVKRPKDLDDVNGAIDGSDVLPLDFNGGHH